jgi:hypothetical protein
MTTRCSICRHPARVDIDTALASGITHSQLARDFHVHRSSVARHAQAHLSTALARVAERGDDAPAEAIIQRATQLYRYCEVLLDRAESLVQRQPGRARAITVAAAVIREARATLVMVANTISQASANLASPEELAEPVDLYPRMVAVLRAKNQLWELEDGTLEYSAPCRQCGYRPPPSGALRDPNEPLQLNLPDQSTG